MSFSHFLADAPPVVTTTTSSPAAGTATPGTAAPGSATTQPSPPFWASPLFLPVILLAVFLIFSSKSKRSQQKKVQDMLGNIKKGDRVQTIGGILGTVVEARENEIVVKVDETNNTKIHFSRKAIHRVVEEEPTEKK